MQERSTRQAVSSLGSASGRAAGCSDCRAWSFRYDRGKSTLFRSDVTAPRRVATGPR